MTANGELCVIMARVSHDKAMKDMVIKVKELCKGVDDNSVQILLQQYDFNFEQTVQAILDGSAEETLREWKSLGNATKTTVSKKKKKNKNKNSGQNPQSTNGSPSVQNVNHVTSNAPGLYNGGILPDAKSLNGSFFNETDSAESKESRIPIVDQPSLRQNAQQSRPKEDYKQQTKKVRDRTLSEASTSSGTNKPYKGPHAGLEKSLKDLQRQTVSLQRLKVVLNEQVDKAFKRISEVFKELHNQLNEREAQLIFTMDKAKAQANDVLEEQQLKAVELKHQTDRAQTMKDSEVADLRSRIKFFVSERKHFEDLSHAQRFVCDFSHILEELRNFGEVVPIKTTPDRRASVASLGSQEDVSSPGKPSATAAPATAAPSATAARSATATTSATAAPLSSQSSLSSHQVLAPVSVPTVAAAAATTTAAASSPSAAVPAAFIPNSSHVLMQSESLTKYEATEMAQRLANLSLGDSKDSVTASPAFKSPRTERGRGSRSRGSGNTGANTDRSVKANLGDQQRGQSTRGRGRGSRGQGRSNRGQGESGSKSESLPNDDQRSSQSKDINAQSNVNSDEKGDQGTSSKQAQAPKSPSSNPRRGGKRGGRRDNLGGQASGNSMARSGAAAEPIHEETVDHDRNHREDKRSSAADSSVKETSNKLASGDLANGQADALPQRGSRSDRRGGGGGGRHRTENQSLETQEPVLANGE